MSSFADYKLGCGTYRVMIQKRCGESFVCEAKFSKLTYNRILNDISEAEIKIPMRGTCCECLANVNPWEHELAIFRNDELVWVGPIVDMEFDMVNEVAKINAKDLLTWADHRLVELADTEYDPDSTDLGDAYQWLLSQAYCKDPWCMTWSIDTLGVPIERYYPAFDKTGGEIGGGQYPIIGDELRKLSDAGVDYTVIGRHLWGGGVAVTNPIASGVTLMDKHFRAAPTISVAGSRMTNRVVSVGGQGGVTGWNNDQTAIYPQVTGPILPSALDGTQQRFGLLESLSQNDLYDEIDTTELPNPIAQEGYNKYKLLSQPFVYITGGTLTQDTPMSFQDSLIPGGIISIAIETTCRALTDDVMRLTEINVSADAEDEIISITLTPVGAEGLL